MNDSFQKFFRLRSVENGPVGEEVQQVSLSIIVGSRLGASPNCEWDQTTQLIAEKLEAW